MESGRAIGVVMADGELIAAKNVIGALDPKTLMERLLPAQNLPAKVKGELAGLTVFGANIGSARVDFLTQRKPSMVIGSERADVMLPTSMLIGPGTLQATQDYVAGCAAGFLGEEIPIWAASPSMLDRSLTPEGEQQTFYVYVPAVPLKLAGGERWADRRDELGEKVLRMMETVMPDLAGLILARSVRTPEDLQTVSGLERGCMYHADMSLAQMGPWRPTPSLAGYKTPVPGLFHTGAGAHPMGSVNGISGKLAAATVLRGR
jgi:beta-carotene ketolase (CrtO type)